MSRWSSKSRKWVEKIRPVVLDLFDYMCVQCGSGEDLTVDHIIPRALGGEDKLDNLRVLCRSCNSRKGSNYGPVVKEWYNPRYF